VLGPRWERHREKEEGKLSRQRVLVSRKELSRLRHKGYPSLRRLWEDRMLKDYRRWKGVGRRMLVGKQLEEHIRRE
jgi:hypothetical protein